jgi:hypothetical protein
MRPRICHYLVSQLQSIYEQDGSVASLAGSPDSEIVAEVAIVPPIVQVLHRKRPLLITLRIDVMPDAHVQ